MDQPTIKFTKEQILNPGNLIEDLLYGSNLNALAEFETEDGPVTMMIRYAIINLLLARIPVKHGMPLRKRYLIHTGLIKNSTITARFTNINKDMMRMGLGIDLRRDFYDSINDISNLILEHLGAYPQSVSSIQISKLMNNPRIKAIRDRANFPPDTPTAYVEQELDKLKNELIETLSDPTLEDNCYYIFIVLGLINPLQLMQIFLAIGIRTDTSDEIIRYPVNSSFFEGLQSNFDFIIESLSAKKVVAYLGDSINKAQYFNRTSVLAALSLKYVYKGDCGTPLTIPMHVTEYNHGNFIGKYYVDNGELKLIDDGDTEALIGRIINMRSLTVCRHTNGTCQVCGGMLTHFIKDGFKPGCTSVIEFTNPTTQKILSAKHFQITFSMSYHHPKALDIFFTSIDDKVYWRGVDFKVDNVELGISIKDIGNLSDLRILDNIDAVKEEHFSTITALAIRSAKDQKPLTKPVLMENSSINPYFSKHVLWHIKEHYADLKIEDDVLWTPMVGYDIANPIFWSIIQNDSMILFVRKIDNFLTTKIAKHTSLSTALGELSSLIHSKVKANIMHLEMIIKACTITNKYNYKIPVVEDPDNVILVGTKKINISRSIGSSLAYERLWQELSHPNTWVMPRESSDFDQFLRYFNQN